MFSGVPMEKILSNGIEQQGQVFIPDKYDMKVKNEDLPPLFLFKSPSCRAHAARALSKPSW